jgi:dTDP-4-dehydrorhamnose 3,5-epimerase
LRVIQTKLGGCFVLQFPEHRDTRGNFFRKYCEIDFENNQLNTQWQQTNYSLNIKSGTLRGFHYQTEPFQEIKLVTCTSGSIYDVILDLRPESKTFMQTFSVNLTSESNTSIYIAKGVAHAYLSLEDNTSVIYQVSKKYSLANTRGVNYLDPKLKINWPLEPKFISEKDINWDFL